jgi:hypothetical protein
MVFTAEDEIARKLAGLARPTVGGWRVKIGRGLDIYQPPDNWFVVGANDFELRPTLETMVDIFTV